LPACGAVQGRQYFFRVKLSFRAMRGQGLPCQSLGLGQLSAPNRFFRALLSRFFFRAIFYLLKDFLILFFYFKL
jgi:hypothetical protein